MTIKPQETIKTDNPKSWTEGFRVGLKQGRASARNKFLLEGREDGYKEALADFLKILNDDSMSREDIISQLDSPQTKTGSPTTDGSEKPKSCSGDAMDKPVDVLRDKETYGN